MFMARSWLIENISSGVVELHCYKASLAPREVHRTAKVPDENTRLLASGRHPALKITVRGEEDKPKSKEEIPPTGDGGPLSIPQAEAQPRKKNRN
jgi:hypothetical protein